MRVFYADAGEVVQALLTREHDGLPARAKHADRVAYCRCDFLSMIVV